nr:type B 50S ribosomal protein L31 [Haploplasma axanthum]
MMKNIHPETRLVIFEDSQTKTQYLIDSAITTKETGIYTIDGNTYPLVKVDTSASSHPFYTGEQTFIQAQGRVDKFNKKYQKRGTVK